VQVRRCGNSRWCDTANMFASASLCNSRYLDQIAQHTEEKLDKHRFLVQSRIVDDSDYNRISALPTSQRSDEVRP
jgi:hypothetical protein